MRELTIHRLYFTNSDCYKAGTMQAMRGVQVHSTGANNPYLKRYVQPDDGRLGRNANGNSHNRPGVDVCAHAYIGRLADGMVAVYQTLPWDYRCWVSGRGKNGNANQLGYIAFEICEDELTNTMYYQQAVMTAAVNLTAYLCMQMGAKPTDVIRTYDDGELLAVMDHSELAKLGLASNHADITHWLRRNGMRMNTFRQEVEKAIMEGVNVTYVDADEKQEEWTDVNALYEVVSPNGGYVNLREAPDVTSKQISRLQPGEKLTVVRMTSVWSEVLYIDRTGYVMTEFLKAVPEESTDTVTIPRIAAQEMYEALGKALAL